MKRHLGKIMTGAISVIVVAFSLWLGLWRLNIPFTFGGFGSFLYYGVFTIVTPAIVFILGVATDHKSNFAGKAAFKGG